MNWLNAIRKILCKILAAAQFRICNRCDQLCPHYIFFTQDFMHFKNLKMCIHKATHACSIDIITMLVGKKLGYGRDHRSLTLFKGCS